MNYFQFLQATTNTAQRKESVVHGSENSKVKTCECKLQKQLYEQSHCAPYDDRVYKVYDKAKDVWQSKWALMTHLALNQT